MIFSNSLWILRASSLTKSLSFPILPSDRFENMDLTFHRDLRDAFLMLSKEEADRFVVIDAELDIREISNIISEEVLNRFTF